MQFLHPVYLYGLLLITIPVIIHLFKLRRFRTVYFSNLSFIKEALSTHKRKSRLQDLLLLLIRILFIIILSLAFAQPYLPSYKAAETLKDQSIGIFIDCSMSMSNQGIDGHLLDEAKKQALNLIDNFPLETRITLFGSSNGSYHNLSFDKIEAAEQIKAMPFSYSSFNLNDLILKYYADSTRQRIQLPSRIFVLSDFQQNFLNTISLPDSIIPEIVLIQLKAQNKGNIFIDSCWFSEPIHHFGSRIKLSVKINNTGEQNYTQFPIRLIINDSLIAQQTVNLEAKSSKTVELNYMPFSNGWQKGLLSINDYPIDFDNNFYFSFSLDEEIKICHLFGNIPNKYLEAAFSSDEVFKYQAFPVNSYPNQNFKPYSTVIIADVQEIPGMLEKELVNFVNNGGNIILFPPENGEQLAMNRFLLKFSSPRLLNILRRPEMSRFSSDLQTFYEEISLNPENMAAWPFFSQYFRLSNQSIHTKAILETQSGRPLIYQTKKGKGYIYLAAFALNESFSSLPTHPVFIPALFFMSSSDTQTPDLFTRIGCSFPLRINYYPGGKKLLQLSDSLRNIKMIPYQYTRPDETGTLINISEWTGPPGFINISESGTSIGTIAINYPREESETQYLSENDIRRIINEHSNSNFEIYSSDSNNLNSYSDLVSSSKLSFMQWLLLASLILLVAETIIYRLKT